MSKSLAKIAPLAESLLDEAVRVHKIPTWPYEASYDRIVVYSVPEEKASRETFSPGSTLIRPAQSQKREALETPRGVIVSAGLGARDVLRSHGIGLGHMVWVARLSPWRHEVDRDADGKTIEFLFLRVGDIVGSETLLRLLKEGRVLVAIDNETGVHRYHFHDGGDMPRFDPPSYVG